MNDFRRTGCLMFKKHFPHGVAGYSGPITLADGTELRLIGMQRPTGYDVEIKDAKNGWKHVSNFALAPFTSELRKQMVDVPNIGSILAYVSVLKDTDEECVRLTILDKKGRGIAPKIIKVLTCGWNVPTPAVVEEPAPKASKKRGRK